MKIKIISLVLPFFLLSALLFATLLKAPTAEAAHINPGVVAVIPAVGGSPADLAVNTVTGRIYSANLGSSTVSVINGATRSVEATIPVVPSPFKLAVNPVTNKVYVAHLDSCFPGVPGPVSVIDGVTNIVETTILVGCRPFGIAVNPVTNLVYVANFSTVTVINGATNTIVASFNCCSNENSAAVNPVTNRIYVGWNNVFAPNVSVINGATNGVEAAVDVESMPWRIAVNSNTNRIYVTKQACRIEFHPCEEMKLFVINGATNLVEAKIPIGANNSGVAVNPATNRVFVTNFSANNVLIINGATNTVESTIPVTNPTGPIAVNPTVDEVYVSTGFGGADVTVIADMPPDTVPPETTINSAVDSNGFPVPNGGSTVSGLITFTFGGTDNVGVAGFDCKVETTGFFACTSPRSFSLPVGTHTFQVRARDLAGNTDPTPASFTWTILTPVQAIDKLINDISSLGLTEGVVNSLSAQLTNARRMLTDDDPDNDQDACTMLDTFIHLVNVYENTNQLTPSQAAQLTQSANAIKVALGCP